jgi:glycosyltransferase involved in cell wall biosynthesis
VLPKALAPASAEAVHFNRGDVYVSLGFDWTDKNLERLAATKRATGLKALLCCYDVIPVKLPQLVSGKNVADHYARYFVDLAWCADELVSISECSKSDLQSFLQGMGAPSPPISVVRLGSDLLRSGDGTVASEVDSLLKHRFVLYVSTIDRRKNHEILYRAYVRLLELGHTDLPHLVFVGKQGGGVGDFINDLAFDGRTAGLIHVLSNVTDSDLALLYRDCLFTVFPSLYEGWGLAVAESLAMGKLCLASPTAAIPEVGGDLVEYLDPWSVPQWAERLAFYFEHPEIVAAAEQRIRASYVPPQWDDAAGAIFARASALLGRPGD